ncbi:hypothetical protein MI149_05605 [Mycolicibacterium crocinum]|uniref:Uncharacterized protein n=1 Tax=Mycolicibacterium crocinum TaxID=388459 RepID=A0ABY3TTA2_9MYCO|nr:hypothetical protein [Mycolicibacterium crocinum]ULN44678.1 hypothetical protein MI149_05605 [Mycolicibacterium crocinum]
MGEPAPQLASFAGVRPGQGRDVGCGAQGGLAGVDLTDVDVHPRDGCGHGHRTVTATAGV